MCQSLPQGSAPTAAALALRLAGLSDVERRQLYGEFYYNQGGSVLVISRHNYKDQWEVSLFQAKNRRIHGLSGLAINATRTDGYVTVTSWGPSPHEQGDNHYLVGTGPAATDVFEGVNSDGLGNKIIGTAFNCSGATTPWETIMSGFACPIRAHLHRAFTLACNLCGRITPANPRRGEGMALIHTCNA
jgi:secreted PhoX family phosphatase